MEKEVCFKIDGQELFAEKILVDYNDIPIFFLCKNGAQYYLVLCTDVHEMCYVIVHISLGELYTLLHGKRPMRSFIQGKDFWEVTSGDEVSSDVVTQHSADELDVSVLPEEGACFKILTEDMETYVDQFDEEFLVAEGFVSTNWMMDIISDFPLRECQSPLAYIQAIDWEKLYSYMKEITGPFVYYDIEILVEATGNSTAA